MVHCYVATAPAQNRKLEEDYNIGWSYRDCNEARILASTSCADRGSADPKLVGGNVLSSGWLLLTYSGSMF